MHKKNARRGEERIVLRPKFLARHPMRIGLLSGSHHDNTNANKQATGSGVQQIVWKRDALAMISAGNMSCVAIARPRGALALSAPYGNTHLALIAGVAHALHVVLRAVSLVILAAAWVIALPVATAVAQQICGPALSVCDLKTDMACLERTYACGEYATVIETLFVEDFALTDDQKYFVGASFYGRQIRERAGGAQCEMVQYSKEYLTDYLGEVEKKFSTEGSFGTVRQMNQIYHAGQMLGDLDQVTGCPESAFTRAAIAAISRAAAVRLTRNVFVNPPAEAEPLFESLMLALRSFVSRASDLETGIALRRVEIASAHTHLRAIRAVFAEIFGAVSGSGPALAVDTSILDGLQAKTAGLLRDVEVQEGAFKAALGGISAEQYGDIRSQTLANADRFLNQSAFHINMIGVLLPTDPARPFWKLVAAVNADGAGKSAATDLAKIRSDWAAHGAATGICAQPGAANRVWYCR